MPTTSPRSPALCAHCDFPHCAPPSSPPSPPPTPSSPSPPIANIPPTTASTGPADIVNDLVYQGDRFVGVAGATFAGVYGGLARAEERAASREAENAALRREVEALGREREGLKWALERKEERIQGLEEGERRVGRLMGALLEEVEGREEADRMVAKMAGVLGEEVEERERAEGRVGELEREVEGLRKLVEGYEWKHQELKGDFMRV